MLYVDPFSNFGDKLKENVLFSSCAYCINVAVDMSADPQDMDIWHKHWAPRNYNSWKVT